MLYRFSTTCLIACGLILGALGCSQTSSPTTPITPTHDTAIAPQHMCWGVWDVTIDADTGEVETVPIRTADFNANVVRFLQPPISPIELVRFNLYGPECDLVNGLLEMEITLRHPFPGRMMFRGFDVKGILMADGGSVGKYDPSMTYASPDQTELLNPDGFTRWWNQVEFTTYGTIFGYTEGHFATPGYTSTSTLNPYKLFAFGLEPTQPVWQMDPRSRATFPVMDGFVKRRYRVQFDISQQPRYRFKYAIDACWSLPDPAYAPDYPVEAYDSMANQQEPYYVRVEEFTDIPYYVDEWVAGGDLEFLLTIGDWQATGGNVLDEISHVWVESPTLFEFPIDVRDTMTFVESTTDTKATYNIRIEDMMPDALKGQQMLITVESAWPDTYEPQIDIPTDPWTWPASPLAAHAIADVPVTNLTPQGNYAYVYFIPDWCATMRHQCADDSQNQLLMGNIYRQNIEGPYNDYTHVKSWEGRSGTNPHQPAYAFEETCDALGFTHERDSSTYFDASGCRVVIAVIWHQYGQALDPPLTYDEAMAMLEFIQNGGILLFMCEATQFYNEAGNEEFFGWLGMLMEYGGGATPEMEDGWTSNITWHWMTDNVDVYHYYTCGEWITQDPHVLTLVATEYDEKAVLIYPLPLE